MTWETSWNPIKSKKEALLNTALAFHLKRYSKTSISDIVRKCRCRQRHIYLYFSDEYDIPNKLISHEASQLFKNAYKQMLSSHDPGFLKTRSFYC